MSYVSCMLCDMAIESARGRRTTTKKKLPPGQARVTATPKRPKATVVATLSNASAPKGVRQANVVKVEQLKNKSTLTTLKGGRKIQQVAGKSAYVVAKGNGPARKRPGQKPAGMVNRSAAVPFKKKK